MSEARVLRERFAVDDRSFTVLADPWYDAEASEWRGRLLFVPLDRSFPRPIASSALRRSRRRDELLEELESVSDAELTKALRALTGAGRRRR